MKRLEQDFLGEVSLLASDLFGIQSFRARNNFPPQKIFSKIWYEAMGKTKKAALLTALDLYRLIVEKKSHGTAIKDPLSHFSIEKFQALIQACDEISHGEHFCHFIVPAISGGAGTSINMNVNEILANRALVILGKSPGDYADIDPVLHANIFQSTNDVVPTALRVAVMKQLQLLENNIASLRNNIEKSEAEHRHTVRMAYTQLQAAVPSTFGRLFSTYNEALSRDWWRISKCWERIKIVNLGGGAIGSGLSIPRYFIFHCTQKLAEVTALPVARGENLQDATANLDMWVEIHAMLKALAVNLIKMTSDLRLLASDFHQSHQLKIPAQQVGSTIMPGKVNPVICEYAISVGEKVLANDSLLTHLCSMGQFDLNAYIPLIGDCILESLELLNTACIVVDTKLITGLKVEPELNDWLSNPSMVTILNSEIGYHHGALLAKHMRENSTDIVSANKALNLISEEKLKILLSPQKWLELGYTLTTDETIC